MIDHIGMAVSDLEASTKFYTAALAPLGYGVVMEADGFVGLGVARKPDFWLSQGGATVPRLHVAFMARDRATVDAFHAAALAAGGTDNGRPGIREHYHPNYYGAFVVDPDGHNVEAVCHREE